MYITINNTKSFNKKQQQKSPTQSFVMKAHGILVYDFTAIDAPDIDVHDKSFI